MATIRHALLVSGPAAWPLQLAAAWRAAGDDVAIVLLDGAVTAARASAEQSASVADVLARGATVLVDDSALRRRGMTAAALVDGAKIADLDEIADLIADGSERVVWL